MTYKRGKYWSDYADDYFKTLYKDVKEYPSLIIRHNYILDLLDSEEELILDIGCGPGEMIADLVERGKRVCGVDIAEGMLRVAVKNISKRYPDYPATFQCGNIEELHFKNSIFDGVICAGVIEYLTVDDKALMEINRVLKTNGTLILTVRNKVCPFRIFDLLLDRIKENAFSRKMLNGIRGMTGQGPIKYIPYRKHFPWVLDRNLSRYGFRKIDYRYFHFYPFFTPFDKLFPFLFIKKGLKMEKLANKRLGILGSGYIVKARKIREI